MPKGKGDGQPTPTFELDMSVTVAQREALLETLQTRFAENTHRHEGIEWAAVAAKLDAQPEKVATLHAMEITGGEPDVIGLDDPTQTFIFCDCAAESPAGRRSLCYDEQAWQSRKKNKPGGSAMGVAQLMGVEMMTEQQYRDLQAVEPFDLKTSSWVKTPESIRAHGGAIFCDRRYDHVFTYHNGVESYYGARGFRAVLLV